MNNQIVVEVNAIPKPVIESHCKTLLGCIGGFFESEAVQKDFEAWHLQKYKKLPTEGSYKNGKNDSSQ